MTILMLIQWSKHKTSCSSLARLCSNPPPSSVLTSPPVITICSQNSKNVQWTAFFRWHGVNHFHLLFFGKQRYSFTIAAFVNLSRIIKMSWMSKKLCKKIGNLKYFSKYAFRVQLIVFFFPLKWNRHYFLNNPRKNKELPTKKHDKRRIIIHSNAKITFFNAYVMRSEKTYTKLEISFWEKVT